MSDPSSPAASGSGDAPVFRSRAKIPKRAAGAGAALTTPTSSSSSSPTTQDGKKLSKAAAEERARTQAALAKIRSRTQPPKQYQGNAISGTPPWIKWGYFLLLISLASSLHSAVEFARHPHFVGLALGGSRARASSREQTLDLFAPPLVAGGGDATYYVCSANYHALGRRAASGSPAGAGSEEEEPQTMAQKRQANTFTGIWARIARAVQCANPGDRLLRRLMLFPDSVVAPPRIYTMEEQIEAVQRANHLGSKGEFTGGGPVDCIRLGYPAAGTEGQSELRIEAVLGKSQVYSECGRASTWSSRGRGTASFDPARSPSRRQAKRTASAKGCDLRVLPPGQALYPGFHDAHGHVLELGWSLGAAQVNGCESVGCIVQRLEAYVVALERQQDGSGGAQEGTDEWIEGLGWDQSKWSPPIFPTAADFEQSAILRGRKIVLRRVDVHALWVSQAVLDLLTADGKLPPSPQGGGGGGASSEEDWKVDGGIIVRDPQGRPTGIFVDKAMELVYSSQPAWTDSDRAAYLHAASQKLLSVGITNVGDAAVDPDSIDFFARQDAKGRLPLRLYAMMDCSAGKALHTRCKEGTPLLPAPESSGEGSAGRGTGRFTARAVKLFADGALGSWGSAMWEPYEDNPGETGLLLIQEKEIEPTIERWMKRGFQVATRECSLSPASLRGEPTKPYADMSSLLNIDCIGDRANTLVLDAYERILEQMGASSAAERLRPRIEHAQIMRPADIPRFSGLGVIPSMQPTHCTSDMGYVSTRLGAQRAAHGAYPWRSLQRAGARLALGSDFPVEQPDVLHGFYSAITRAWPDGSSPFGAGRGWYANETLSRAEAMRGFTSGASFAQFEERQGGRIMPGFRADFTLLQRDVMDAGLVGERETREVKVLGTVIGGTVEFAA